MQNILIFRIINCSSPLPSLGGKVSFVSVGLYNQQSGNSCMACSTSLDSKMTSLACLYVCIVYYCIYIEYTDIQCKHLSYHLPIGIFQPLPPLPDMAFWHGY
jgi:hypothetical protein